MSLVVVDDCHFAFAPIASTGNTGHVGSAIWIRFMICFATSSAFDVSTLSGPLGTPDGAREPRTLKSFSVESAVLSSSTGTLDSPYGDVFTSLLFTART